MNLKPHLEETDPMWLAQWAAYWFDLKKNLKVFMSDTMNNSLPDV